MGRINKRFTVENEHGHASGVGKIDSGADVSLVRLDVGKKLGLDVATSETIALGGIGQQRVVGFRVPARVRVGESAAQVDLAVPIGTVNERGRLTVFGQRHNLIGHDFLQATGAKLDFSRPHNHAFVEGETLVDDVEVLRITPTEERALLAWARRNLRPVTSQVRRYGVKAMRKRGKRSAGVHRFGGAR